MQPQPTAINYGMDDDLSHVKAGGHTKAIIKPKGRQAPYESKTDKLQLRGPRGLSTGGQGGGGVGLRGAPALAAVDPITAEPR